MNLWNLKLFWFLSLVGFITSTENSSVDDPTQKDYPRRLSEVSTQMDYPRRLSEASNQFGLNLLSELSSQTSGNVVIAPISISVTFGLIYFGSRGETEKELESVLGYQSVNMTRTEVSRAFHYLLTQNLITFEPRAYILDLASAVFVNDRLGLSPDFKTAAEELFLSPVEKVDFSDGGSNAVGKINEMVRNKTKEKICGILDSLDPSADLVAVNALYFKSQWLNYFPETNTKEGIFYNSGINETSVQMMEQEGTFLYYENDEISLVHLGFWGRNMSMFILLPHQRDGLLNLEKSLTHNKLSHYLMNAFPQLVQITLPKFNISYSSDLVQSLQNLGAKEIFQPTLANLSGMVLDKGIAIGEVKHKTIVEVNESGVEASGVTATLSFRSLPIPDGYAKKFTVDHPFMFIILDERTDLVILLGRIWNL